VIVAATAEVPVNTRLGALSAEPPVVPTVYTLDAVASDANPPVPVQLKLVALSIISAVLLSRVNVIVLEPNVILRVLLLFDVNVSTVMLPVKFSVPAIKLNSEAPLTNVCVPSNVSVRPGALYAIPAKTLLYCIVQVVVPVNVGVNPVYVPVLDNTIELALTVPVIVPELPVKSNMLK